MSSIADIEAAISRLDRDEFARLSAWFDELRSRKWDQQIEEDARSGKLQELYNRLRSENEGHATIPLNEFLDDEKLS